MDLWKASAIQQNKQDRINGAARVSKRIRES